MTIECFMRFLRTKCEYKAKSDLDLTRHIREVHEPESLKINGFDPGFDEPYKILVNRVLPSGNVIRTTEYSDQIRVVGN